MSEKSRPGLTPCVYRFNASVTRSTLPVRSPLPNKQPSTRSAPAITASSAEATAVPRSLCGCTLMMMEPRRASLRDIHSIWSAYTLGVLHSTVDGRLTIILLCGVGSQIAVTASQICLEKSSSVVENDSGVYSKPHSVCGCCLINSLTSFVPVVAMLVISSRDMPKTTLRNTGATELYRATMARLAPATDSTVRRISSSRDCVSTMTVTSSGMRFSSTSLRTKSKSVCDADGKPTSISLMPILTSSSKKRSFFSALIGSISAWLPSRRSVLIQIGGLVMTWLGQWRSDNWTGGKARYFAAGFCNIMGCSDILWCGDCGCRRGRWCGDGLPGGHGILGQATDR